MDRRTDSQT